jgi:hypothetical protein
MEQVSLALEGAWKVLLVGLVLGAGLPAIFATGVRSLAWGVGGEAEVSHARPNPLGRVVAALLFAVVAYAVISGILFVIASGQGKALDFSSVIPTFVDKK